MKKYIAIFLILLLSISLYGCSNLNSSREENRPDMADENKVAKTDEKMDENMDESIEDGIDENTIVDYGDENNNQVVEPNPKADKVDVKLYFVNKEYIELGDESLDKLIPENRTIVVENASLEEAIIRELIKGTEANNLSTAIPSNIVLLGVEVADGTAFVNLSQEGLYGSSMQEELTIAQIVNTLLELDHVDKVQFLVDGKKAETLMGHISITEPFQETLN